MKAAPGAMGVFPKTLEALTWAKEVLPGAMEAPSGVVDDFFRSWKLSLEPCLRVLKAQIGDVKAHPGAVKFQPEEVEIQPRAAEAPSELQQFTLSHKGSPWSYGSSSIGAHPGAEEAHRETIWPKMSEIFIWQNSDIDFEGSSRKNF